VIGEAVIGAVGIALSGIGLGALLASMGLHRRVARGMYGSVRAFYDRFPGRCLLCSVHRWAASEGHIPRDEPIPAHPVTKGCG
jgi:hypothetical protein